MHCPVCRLRVEGRSQLIAHLRAARDQDHKTALHDSSPIYQELRGLHVLPCPLGCGAVYDGGKTGTSRHFDTHVEKRNCSKGEASGPWCATTMTGIQNAARERLAANTSGDELVSASNAITHCLLHSGFMREHIQSGRVTTSTGVPLPALDLITAAATDVMVKANSLAGILRVAAMDAVMLFPSLILYPHEKGACSTQVRTEVKRRLALWGAGNLESLAALARASRVVRPFSSGTKVKPSASQRARALIHRGQFSRAAMLADSFGVAPASAETLHALTLLHPGPGDVRPEDMNELYGEAKLVRTARSETTISRDKVRECIAAAPPLTSPHRDGWRMEHLEALGRDDTFAAALAVFISNIASGDVPPKTADYFASATLIALLKKNEEDITALRELMGPDFVLPIRPLAMACVFVKLACNCMLSSIKDDIEEVTGPSQFAVGCKGGCEALQWALQAAMEADPDFAQAVMDAINGFNELERLAMRAAILADPRLHRILPLFDMLYTDREGELWYFDEDGNLMFTLRSRRGVRQGCVLGIFIFCVTMAPIYRNLRTKLGPAGMLVAFSDDCYLHGPPVHVAEAISAAPPLYRKVGLRIGWGPAKSELALPHGVDPDSLPLPRGDDGHILPCLVAGLEACLGLPRHRDMCPVFITRAMRKPAARHDRLLRLITDIAEDAPLTALRLLQVSGVNRFGHVISTVPPAVIRGFAEARDAAVVRCFEAIQQHEVSDSSTHALPIGAGGAALHSLAQHGGGSHLGTYYRIAGPLIARLLLMGGSTPRRVAANLQEPPERGSVGGWAAHLHAAHRAAVNLQDSFTAEDLNRAFLLAPRGLLITLPGDPTSAAKDLPQTVETAVVPTGCLSPGPARGIRHVAAGLRRLQDWRKFLDILSASPTQVRTKLLSHSGHGSVSVLHSDIHHAGNVSAEAARVTIRRLTGAPALGRRQRGPTHACPVCDTRGSVPEALEQHAVRCPAGGARAYMHAGLITTLQKVLQEAGVSTSATLTEARGLRGRVDRTRPGDIVVLDFHAPGRHLLLDGVVTTVYRNTRQRETGVIPGYAAKLAEDRKFYADKTSERPVARPHGGLHTLVPFAVEDGGRLGAHAQAFLRALAERAVAQGRMSRPPLRDPSGCVVRGDGATQVSLWVQRWQRHISTWLHISLSRQLLRLFCPQQAAEDFFS